MAIVYYPSGSQTYVRTVTAGGMVEQFINVLPDQILFLSASGTANPIPVSTASYALTASFALNGGGGGGGTINATFATPVTASQQFGFTGSISMQRMVLGVFISSSHINLDGSDIRVQSVVNGVVTGSYLPIRVHTYQISNSLKYNVSWFDNFTSNSVNYYLVEYGDPTATYQNLTYAQYRKLWYMGAIIAQNTNSIVYVDNTQADSYGDADWGTIGTRLTSLTNADDTTQNFAVPSYWWDSNFFGTASVNSNGIVGLAGLTLGGPTRGATSPNSMGVTFGDGVSHFADYCVNSDGFAFQYSYQFPFSTSDEMKMVWRYYNGGKWVCSVFSANPAYQTAVGNNYAFAGYTGGTPWSLTFNVSPLTSSLIPSFRAIVIEPVVSSSIGNERSYP